MPAKEMEIGCRIFLSLEEKRDLSFQKQIFTVHNSIFVNLLMYCYYVVTVALENLAVGT